MGVSPDMLRASHQRARQVERCHQVRILDIWCYFILFPESFNVLIDCNRSSSVSRLDCSEAQQTEEPLSGFTGQKTKKHHHISLLRLSLALIAKWFSRFTCQYVLMTRHVFRRPCTCLHEPSFSETCATQSYNEISYGLLTGSSRWWLLSKSGVVQMLTSTKHACPLGQ